MNIKSYFRGVGAGMIFTAIIMGIAAPKQNAGSDVVFEKNTLTSVASATKTPTEAPTKTPTKTPTETPTETPTQKPEKEPTTTPTKEPTSAPTSAPTSEPTSEPTAEPEGQPIDTTPAGPGIGENGEITPPPINPLPEDDPGYAKEAEYVEIKVVRGDSSVSVARRMYEAGLIESAVEFDSFLCKNGYDRYVCTGTHQIPYGLSFEEMAAILMKRK